MTNKRISVVNGEVVPFQSRARILPYGTFIVVRYGVSNFRPNGKGERIARVFDDNGDTTIGVTEWILSSRRWRREHRNIARRHVLRVATPEDIKRFQPGVTNGPKRSRGW